MAKKKERARIITRHTDGSLTIAIGDDEMTLAFEEWNELASDLVIWRWRLTGDSYDPRVDRTIQSEGQKRMGNHPNL